MYHYSFLEVDIVLKVEDALYVECTIRIEDENFAFTSQPVHFNNTLCASTHFRSLGNVGFNASSTHKTSKNMIPKEYRSGWI